MDDELKPIIKVASPSFSRNDLLVNELKCLPVRVMVNDSGSHLHGEKLANYIGEADGAIIGLENIDIELLERCPDLKMISKYGVGLDNINLNECKKRAIYIGWEPGLNKRAVAEVVLGQMLGLSRNLFTQSSLCQKEKCIYFSFGTAFNFSMSSCMCLVSLVNFLSSFFSRIISLISTNANSNTRKDMNGRTSIDHFSSSFASCFNCHPRRIGKNKRIIHPIARSPTAHSRFIMSHSRVSQSIN